VFDPRSRQGGVKSGKVNECNALTAEFLSKVVRNGNQKKLIASLLSIRAHGATVVRLTPDQEVGRSNGSRLNKGLEMEASEPTINVLGLLI
jgi:hypothetical protein